MLKDKKRLGFSLSCLLLLASLCVGADGLAYPPGWSDDIRVTEDSQDQMRPDVAVSSRNHLWCVWLDQRDSNDEIYFTKLDSAGGTLIDDTNLSSNPTNSRHSVVAVDSSDNVHIVWRDVGATGFDVWYAKLDSAGNVLVPNKVVAYASGSIMGSLLPAIAMDSSNNMHIIWDQYVFPANEMHYTKLDENGEILVSDRMVSLPGVYARDPAAVVDSYYNLHVIWSDDSGAYLGWMLTYTKLDSSGNILVGPIWLTPDDDYSSNFPAISLDPSGALHILFSDLRTGYWDIFYTKLDGDGNTLINDTNVTNGSLTCFRPDIAIDSRNGLHLVWYAQPPGLAMWNVGEWIYYAKMDTSGQIVTPPIMVVDAPSYSEMPELTVDSSDRLHLVWQDYRNNNWDIYYKRGENEVGVEEMPEARSNRQEARLMEVHPNPFHSLCSIRYQVPGAVCVRLRVYDAAGQLVRTLVDEQKTSGEYRMLWDGRSENGESVPPGVYFYRLEVGGMRFTRKAIRLQ